jgi:hypothetical protein
MRYDTDGEEAVKRRRRSGEEAGRRGEDAGKKARDGGEEAEKTQPRLWNGRLRCNKPFVFDPVYV